MLESYVTPLLMSYVNKYIKNLKPSDLQLSLWGGDVVLSKLDLKLDVLEQELKLPFTFMSGHIHELRIHVPWTKLGSESVVITINTMECILKLRDGAQDDHDSTSSSTSRSASDSSKAVAKPRRLQQVAPSDPDLPPGYVQSLIRRVVNNVNIVVNNLILKYVEDDIVLSVNITSAECYTVDDIWERAFMDITTPDLVLRKVINFTDCTVCLDKRNASGKIEFYQDPLLYKCSFRTRLHCTYDNINSKIPSAVKIHTMLESLKLSITDQQLPMFIRILELIIALYYGEIGQKEAEGEEGLSHGGESGASSPGESVVFPEGEDQGWVSWAWSFIPAIVAEEGEDGIYQQREIGGNPNSPQQHMTRDPIVSIGLYCTKASITFKLTETQSESSYYSPQKVKSREVLCVEQEGITVEVLMMGEPFFDCQIGFVGCRAICLKSIMGVRDFEENINRREEDAVFLSCGDSLSMKGMTYLTNSLFDYRSPENNGVRAEFILDAANHKETYTEIAGMQRFGAFYMDYLYTMENSGGKGSQEFLVSGMEEAVAAVEETSIKRLVVGPLNIKLHSSAIHRILKMITCAMDHEYVSYCRPQPETVKESTGPATPEEISDLEEFIPTRLTCLTLLQVSVTVSMAEFNLLHTLMPVIMVSVPVFHPTHPLPSVQFQVERVNVEHSVPMYAPKLVSALSSLSQPPDNLLHHCYAHLYLKVFGFQAGLTCRDVTGDFRPLIPIIPSFSTALYGKLIQLPALWSKRSSVPTTECILELPHFTIQATRAQTLLLQAIYQSWTHSMVNGSPVTLSESLLSEVFKVPGVRYPGPSPTLEGLVQNVELKFCSRAMVKCASGTVGAVKVCARTPGVYSLKEKLVPLIQGPSDTKDLYMSRWLNEIRKPESLLAPDLLVFSVQVPQQGDDCRHSGKHLARSTFSCFSETLPGFVSFLSFTHKNITVVLCLPGDAFPWTISLSQFSIYTLLGQQQSLSLLEPMGCTSTLAVTSKVQSSSEGRPSFVVCLHVDLQPVHVKCSNPQVQLLYELLLSWSSTWARLQRLVSLRQTPSAPEPPAGAAPSSPVRSSTGTALPDTSTCSPSADFGSPTEGDSVPAADDGPFADTVTLEQKTSSIEGTSGKVSLWMQWMLPKVTVQLFAPEPGARKTEICVVGELEDLSASVDVQDVYTKIKCKVGSFNIDHYRFRFETGLHSLPHESVFLFFVTDGQTAAKVLEGSHQQHGFLSITYTQAVTKNVRHKLITRPERPSRSGVSAAADPLLDSSPQYLREILLTAQPFDVVLSFPLLATAVTVPRRCKEYGKSAGQPMRSHALSSRSLPLIYINTSVIRIFYPSEKKENTLVLKLGSLSMAPQADNPLTRTVLRKDIYQHALNLGILRDPGSEVEDRQYQVDLQSINIGTAQWEQLKPEKEGLKGGAAVESERSSQNPALEWNMASSIRRHQERRAIVTPILTDFSVRVTAAPAIIFSKSLPLESGPTEEVVVCGHSLEVNVTSSLDLYLSVAQIHLLQQLFKDNMVDLEASEKNTERSSQEPAAGADSSPRHSGAGHDSGFGSDSARIRIVQIEQQSGASHHCIARPSRKSTITKNLSFIPFDIFVTASKLSLMTYSCCSPPKSISTSSDTPTSASPTASPTSDPGKAAPGSLATLTAEDILNSNTSHAASPLPRRSLVSLDGLPTPTRSSARQALGVTIVRQPGRRGAGDQVLEPFLFLQVAQPSVLLSCHHRKQKMELSVFDMSLRGVASDYKCLDIGKTLPEPLDYNVFWIQTVAGEADSKTGIPPPLLCLRIKDFLNGPAELTGQLSRPLKVSLTLTKLEQTKAYLKKVLSVQKWDTGSSLALTSSIKTLARSFHRVSVHTTQMVVTMETEGHALKPSLTVSLSALTGILHVKTAPRTEVQSASLLLKLKDALVKTGLRNHSRVLLGPFSCSSSVEARWCRHSGSPGAEPGPPKLLLDLKGGLLQIFWGQEHLNCLMLVGEHLRAYFHPHKDDLADGSSKGRACHTQPQPSPSSSSPRTEHSSDDLRTGNFQYIQDSGECLLPGPHEVVFYSETEDSPGVMLWRYPEPRVLTFVRITPVPFNTTEDPEISTADLGDVLQIPCSLEYWDELQQAFVLYREFSLSESSACQLQLPSLSLSQQQKKLVASDLWRIVLNHSGEGGDEQSSDSECGSQAACDQLVSPTALAACARVDSCFATWFVPALGVSIQLAQLEVRLCHHLEQLGTEHCLNSLVPCRKLRPFLPDRKLPQEQEFLVIAAREPQLFVHQWDTGPRYCQEFSFSTQLDCKLLEYRNLTHLQLLQPCVLQASLTSCPQSTSLDVNVFVDPVFINIGQYAIHTLDTALLSWQQNGNADAEEPLYSHYVICNDTHETLRFGQVDTDENVLLPSLHSHQYSWRSHKSSQLLHICIEGWGNWRWSEPFSVDNVGMLLRTIQYKGRTASLIIKVLQLSGVQKQVIICGRQVMCSYLTEDIELRVVQHYVGPDGQTVVKEHCNCLDAGTKLPSYVLEDTELTELSVKARGDEDWSQDVQLETKDKGTSSSVVQVGCSGGSLLFVWCTLITTEADSPMQQRVIFSPLFIMRSHLPDPIVIHIEKRNLGLKESQLIQGQGHQEPLLNTEAHLNHHLTFQAREDEDASLCAVPISTNLIKQILSKAEQEDKPELLLSDFYGPKTTTDPPWPYVTKDPDRSVMEPLAQWDSPMQVKLSRWKSGLNTLLVELLPWALLVNSSQWDLWLFEGETIVLQIPAGKVIVPPNFKQEAFQIGVYWAPTNTVHKSPALKLVHDLTSPRWKEGFSSVVVTLDEEGYVDVDITLGAFPGKQKLCQFTVSSVVRHGIQILQIEDRTILVNNTPYTIHCSPLLTAQELGGDEQVRPVFFTVKHSAVNVGCLNPPSCTAVGFPLPLRHMLLSFPPGLDVTVGSTAWSLPAPVRPDFPRQSVSVPVDQDCQGGLCSRWVAIVLTYQEHLGVTYITLSEDPCPRMLIQNRCPVHLLFRENVKETPRAEVYCRRLPANSSLHHELYHHVSGFPDCRQKETLPTVQLKSTLDQSPTEWTNPIDINYPGTQVVFLPGFGCLYTDVSYDGGTLVLSLAPEGSVDAMTHQHTSGLSFRVLLAEVSAAVTDDITSTSGSVELLRLTLTKLLLSSAPAGSSLASEPAADSGVAAASASSLIEVCCSSLQVDNQLYNRTSFHFPVLLCQDQRGGVEPAALWSIDNNPTESPEALEEFRRSCFLQLRMTMDRRSVEEVTFQLQPARVYLEDTFVYYVRTLFHTYMPDRAVSREPRAGSLLPEQVHQSVMALVHPVRLQRLTIQPVNLLVSIHASLKLYIASDHTPLSFSGFERGPLCTTARQLVHALAMHYAAGALFRAGWVVGSLEILGSPASLVRSIGNGVSDFFRLPYEGLTRGPGAFVSGVSRGTTSFVKHISKGTLTSITNLATSLARNMDRLSLDEEHYTRQEEWRRQLPESLGDGLRQGLSRLGISLLGAIAGIVDQPMQNFQRNCESQSSAGTKAKGVISGVGKGIVGVFTKPIGGAAELVSQTGYGILHGAGLWQLPKQLYQPAEEKFALSPNSHLKYVW
uniref:Vacuolar protein sorting 13 homolog B n=1 Tax=Oryzias sinensis TaxID=183150 RepID=A0A8C7Y913_9TELE